MPGKRPAGILFVLLVLLCCAPRGALASDTCRLALHNALGVEIINLWVRYGTPRGEPRNDVSTACIQPGALFRLGIQGVTLPERMVLNLPAGTIAFADLSGISPEQNMALEVRDVDGIPRLIRTDKEDRPFVAGSVRTFLTPGNQANAVDRDFLTDAVTMDQVRELVREAVEEQEGNTVPLEKTLFEETDLRGGTSLRFPVQWSKWHGVAGVTPMRTDDPEKGLVISITMPYPLDEAPEMMKELLEDLRVDDFRPMRAEMQTLSEDGNVESGELFFVEGTGDEYDDSYALFEPLLAAYAANKLLGAASVWITDEAFAKKRAGEEFPPSPGVLVRLSRSTLTATFIRDARLFVN